MKRKQCLFLNRKHWRLVKKGAGLDSKEYIDALKTTLGSRKIIDDMMSEHKLNAIIGTSIGLPNCIDLVNGDYWTGFYFCPPAAMAGYPHIYCSDGHRA